MNTLSKSLIVVISSTIIALLGWALHYRNDTYYNRKETYYNCIDNKNNVKFLPIKQYKYLAIEKTASMEGLICTKAVYTKFYIQLLKETYRK